MDVMNAQFAKQFNLRSPAVKRLMKEAAELSEPTEDYYAQPLEHNLFEWHFTVRGPPDTDFAGGYYHGRIILPTEYPMKPPSIILLTANGRFEVNKKICLSISGHHPESWQPSWSIRTALLAIIGFMPTESRGAIGGLDYIPEERRALATKSKTWSCPTCGPIKALLKEQSETSSQELSSDNKEAKELAKQIRFKELVPGNSNGTGNQEVERIVRENEERDANSSLNNDNQTTDARRRRVGVVSNEHSLSESPYQQSSATSISSTSSQHEITVQSSRTRFSTYLIVILTLAIAFLVFRRIFLTDSE